MTGQKWARSTSSQRISITGERLRLAGEASDNCGLYFAPQAAGGTGYDADETKWKRMADAEVYKNKPSELLVHVPSTLTAGNWYIAIRTKAPSTGKVDEDTMLKTPRFGVSSKACTVM